MPFDKSRVPQFNKKGKLKRGMNTNLKQILRLLAAGGIGIFAVLVVVSSTDPRQVYWWFVASWFICAVTFGLLSLPEAKTQ